MLSSLKRHKATIIIALVLSILITPRISLNSRAQTTHSLYLNRVGFFNMEVGYDVHVVENYAYVTNNDGLMIIDIQNPRNPQKVGEVLCGGSFEFGIENDIAYITTVLNGFVISNVSNPSSTQTLGQDSVAGATRIAVLDLRAYVTYQGLGFKIFNISDPTNPDLLGEYSDTRSDGIKIKGNFAYFSNADVGLRVVNVSNPSLPQLVATVPQTGGACDIHITNDILYLGCWGAGIRVIDISDPSSPQILDSYVDNDGGEELGVIEKDNLLYVADNGGIELFDASDPSSIYEIAERTIDVDAAHDIDVDDEYIYVALAGGLLILETSLSPEIDPIFIIIIILSSVAALVVISSVIYLKVIKSRKFKEMN